MANHRQSEEERILNYFQSAPFAKVEVLFNLIRPIAKKRIAESRPQPTGMGATGTGAGTGAKRGRKPNSQSQTATHAADPESTPSAAI